MGFMSTSKRLASKAKSLLPKTRSEAGSSDVASSSRAAPGSFDFQPELYGDDAEGKTHNTTETDTAAALKPGKRPSRGSGSLVRVGLSSRRTTAQLVASSPPSTTNST